MRRIFQMAVDGIAPTQIALRLNAEGIPSPLVYRRENHTDGLRGWKVSGDISYWTRENVRRIIFDERYTGCLISRKRTTVDVSKKQTVKVPKEEWIVAKNTHKAIVTEETYAQAQKVLKSCKRKKTPAKPNQRFRGLLKCAVCGRTLERVICKEPYFCCPTRKTVPDALCRRVHVDEQDLETALTASIQSRARLLLEAEAEHENENLPDALEKQIQECQTAISRCKAKQADAFEDYAEGRITRQEYLTRKAEAARQHDDMTASYMELSAKRVELQKAADSAEKMDLGRYACVGELTKELLTELIREIRVSGEDDLEIVWNFRE